MIFATYFRHHSSFTHHFEPQQNGIDPVQAEAIAVLIQAQNFKEVLIYCTDHKIICYGIIDCDGAEMDFFFSPDDLIDYLNYYLR